MLAIRRILGLLIVVVCAIAHSAAFADVERFVFSASPDAATLVGITRHEISLDTSKHAAVVKSFDRADRLIAEITASKDGTTMRRYVGEATGSKLIDEVVLDSSGRLVSVTSTNAKALGSWTKNYIDELAKQSVPWSSTKKLDCPDKCAVQYLACAIMAAGSVFGELICYGRFLYCVSTCSYGSGGGEPTGPQCGTKKCKANEKCCKGDNICVPKSGACP